MHFNRGRVTLIPLFTRGDPHHCLLVGYNGRLYRKLMTSIYEQCQLTALLLCGQRSDWFNYNYASLCVAPGLGRLNDDIMCVWGVTSVRDCRLRLLVNVGPWDFFIRGLSGRWPGNQGRARRGEFILVLNSPWHKWVVLLGKISVNISAGGKKIAKCAFKNPDWVCWQQHTCSNPWFEHIIVSALWNESVFYATHIAVCAASSLL